MTQTFCVQTRTQESEQWLAHHRMPYFLAGERDKLIHRNIEAVRDVEHIQLNPDSFKNFLVLDVDHKRYESKLAPVRHLIAWVKPSPHGAHIGFMVDSVATNQYRIMAFYDAVRINLSKLIDADLGYGNFATRNPLYDEHTTIWGNLTPQRLGTYRAALADQWTGGYTFRSQTMGQGRNTVLYTQLLMHARANPDADDRALGQVAEAINSLNERPLSGSEVAQVVRSVLRTRDKAPRDSGYQKFWSDLGKRGGLANTSDQRAYRSTMNDERTADSFDRAQTCMKLKNDGWTAQQIADHLSIHVRTVRRLWKSVDVDSTKSIDDMHTSCAMSVSLPTSTDSTAYEWKDYDPTPYTLAEQTALMQELGESLEI